jgi:myo-inositol 2-dehydrogenase / D-chiro-inositol 1-dehydrogenase
MSVLKVGIIGGGRMGIIHLECLAKIPEVELVGIAEPFAGSRDKITAKYNIPGFASASELLKKAKPEAVYISTPIGMHLVNIREAIAAGCHVFCEKPLVPGLKEGKEVVEILKGSDRILFTGLVWRFNNTLREIKKCIASGTIGKVVQFSIICGGPSSGVRPAWFEDRKVAIRGCMLDNGVHFFDMLTWTLGRITKVSAFCDQTDEKIDLNATVMLETESGAIGTIQFTSEMLMGTRFEFYGKDGIISFVPGQFEYIIKRSGQDDKVVKVEENDRFLEMAQAFVDAATGKSKLPIAVKDGLFATAVAEAGYLSMEKGKVFTP